MITLLINHGGRPSLLVTPQLAQTSTGSLHADVYIKMLGVAWTLLLLVVPSLCFNHWMVTEDGKIEYQVQGAVYEGEWHVRICIVSAEDRLLVASEYSTLLLFCTDN